jgi:hypothetical protein
MNNIYKQEKIIQMLNILINNFVAQFGGRVIQQTISIRMGRNCAPLLTGLFLDSYEVDFKGFSRKKFQQQQRRLI